MRKCHYFSIIIDQITEMLHIQGTLFMIYACKLDFQDFQDFQN